MPFSSRNPGQGHWARVKPSPYFKTRKEGKRWGCWVLKSALDIHWCYLKTTVKKKKIASTMRAVLANSRSLPNVRGYPSPLQPPSSQLCSPRRGRFPQLDLWPALPSPSADMMDIRWTSYPCGNAASKRAPLLRSPAPTTRRQQLPWHKTTLDVSGLGGLRPNGHDAQQLLLLRNQVYLQNLEDLGMFAQMQMVKHLGIIPLHAPLYSQAHSQSTFLIVCLAVNR